MIEGGEIKLKNCKNLKVIGTTYQFDSYFRKIKLNKIKKFEPN